MPGEFSFSFPPQPHERAYQTTNAPIPQPPTLPKPLSTETEPTLAGPTQFSIIASTHIPPKPMGAENIQPQPSNALVITRPMIHLRRRHDAPRRRSRSPDGPAEQSAVTRQGLPAEIVSCNLKTVLKDVNLNAG